MRITEIKDKKNKGEITGKERKRKKERRRNKNNNKTNEEEKNSPTTIFLPHTHTHPKKTR